MIISQCPFQELGYRIHVSAAILVSVFADGVLREQLETSFIFLPFWSQLISNLNFFNLFHQYLPPSSEASSLLLESSFSKSEIVPSLWRPFPLAPGVNQSGPGATGAAIYLLCDTDQKSDSSHYWHLRPWTVSSRRSGIRSRFSPLLQDQARHKKGPLWDCWARGNVHQLSSFSFYRHVFHQLALRRVLAASSLAGQNERQAKFLQWRYF